MKCPTCGHQSPGDYIKELVKGATLPEGVSLYDFGDGQVVMPKPDRHGFYLTRNVAYLYKQMDPAHLLFLEIDVPFVPGMRTPEQKEEVLRQAVLAAIKAWPNGATVVRLSNA